jgi:hypothetical protein
MLPLLLPRKIQGRDLRVLELGHSVSSPWTPGVTGELRTIGHELGLAFLAAATVGGCHFTGDIIS